MESLMIVTSSLTDYPTLTRQERKNKQTTNQKTNPKTPTISPKNSTDIHLLEVEVTEIEIRAH